VQLSWPPIRAAPAGRCNGVGNISNGVFENAGVNLPPYAPSSDTDPNLSDYTLSFDLAIAQGGNMALVWC